MGKKFKRGQDVYWLVQEDGLILPPIKCTYICKFFLHIIKLDDGGRCPVFNSEIHSYIEEANSAYYERIIKAINTIEDELEDIIDEEEDLKEDLMELKEAKEELTKESNKTIDAGPFHRYDRM